MMGIEKEILLLISRVRCMTETQVGKVFSPKKRYGRKPFKKTLRKMCNEYTLRKYPCNINYSGYRDNSYVYYLNGSKQYKGKDLVKIVIGSELAIRINMGGYEVKRFYRNSKVGNETFDIFIEYIDRYNELHQLLVDIDIDGNIEKSKYTNLEYKINDSTIPFFELPKVLIVTSKDTRDLSINSLNANVSFIDPTLNKLFRYI
ncbi:hypothetical protein EAI30_08615 [Romboutsia ilealis]|uniref:Uncharacterized protein n=1 Tax=Romboutsia faecis TaxID=2764597 RepID=A0ABR7JPY1_9FIRM|nr:hypothetical protein [Romboutsia faecis]MBC5996817.1 hypothetical protein [Romboutsia faecis]MRN24677.1 hypothetical protein [Romboutsia ilealis]